MNAPLRNIPDEDLIDSLKKETGAAFAILYKKHFGVVASYVKRNNGSTADAEDIFQETIIVFLHKTRRPEFQLQASIKTYLYSIAKHLWLKRLRDDKNLRHDTFNPEFSESESFEFELEPEPSREQHIENWLTKITSRCQQIIKAIFFYHIPMEMLMKKMGWKNKHTAANQQYKCIQQIKKVKDG